jgi:hypothetical protein
MGSTRFKCLQCDFHCGRRTKFIEHLSVHGHSSERDAYVSIALNGTAPSCTCGCGSEPQFVGWNQGFRSWADGHNAKLSALPLEEADRIREARRATKKERNLPGWSLGLTKGTDERLAGAAEKRSNTMKRRFESGELKPWLKGLTKQTDDRVAGFARRLQEGFASGRIKPWAQGLSKETDERVLNMSLSVKRTMLEESRRARFDKLKQLTPDEIERRLQVRASDLELLSDLGREYVRDRHRNLLFRCKLCGLEQRKSLLQALTNRCDSCSPNMSIGQNEMVRWLQDLGEEVVTCDRSIIKPYELDIVLPRVKLAIEYNGLYFHSMEFKDKDYHRLKLDLAKREGYRLIHVFEDEWRDRSDVVKSVVMHAIGRSIERIDARKCELVKLDAMTRKLFFDSNHMDGDARAKWAWGLTFENRLVACLSLRKPLHKKHGSKMEVCRYATVANANVRGGLGKLMGIAESHCRDLGLKSIMTYVDTRFGKGGGYESVGFVLVGSTSNRFWWTDGKERIDRFKIRADKQAGMTEQQVAESFGVTKIWGCPNLIYEKLL